MAYTPPHKRHNSAAAAAADHPTPDSLPPRFSKSLSLSSSSSSSPRRRRDPSSFSSQRGRKIVYAANCISRWWPASACASDPESFRLEPFSCEIVERRSGGKPLVLADSSGGGAVEERSPWVRIAERAVPDLVEAARRAREEPRSEEEVIKMSAVARVGKVLFHGDSSITLNLMKRASVAEEGPRTQLHKSFYTNVPLKYMDNIEQLLVSNNGFVFESAKEHYHVKVFDQSRPDSTTSCKCTVQKDRALEIHKVELNQVRYMVADISTFKDLDLRLMLNTKRILKSLDAEVGSSIQKLISSAVIDPDVKGGLRWPLGKDSTAERFSIVGVWHTNYKAFRCQNWRLKMRRANRFDYLTSSGEMANEVTLKLTGVSEQLRDGNLETSPLVEMVGEAVQMIWDNFLSYNISSS